ncbi:hypothetical protein EZS27_018823 [termite gut metagenome]|uniref:Transposase DDE domain-containing protein n=1 Tax=termite gut metagenome TaxID=433724 RepID=A0A5J4RGD9_9ZZZZ
MGELLNDLLFQVRHVIKELTVSDTYIIDSFPVALCHSIRIPRICMVQGEQYRGYCASKRSWFYGYKVHVPVTGEGIPVEYTFTPGSSHDMERLRQMPLSLPEGSTLYSDAAYTDYTTEEMLADDEIRLLAARKANSKHPHEPWGNISYLSAENQLKSLSVILPNICLKRFMPLRKKGF